MKNVFFFLITAVVFSLFTISCGDTTTIDENITTDSTATTQTVETPKAPDFNQFFETFKNDVINKNYTAIDFPFHSGGVENKTVAEADLKDHYLLIFEDMKNLTDLKIGSYAGGDIDAYLKENLTKKYGNLDNLYVVEGTNGPESFYAYFKMVGDNYKMVGLHYVPGGM